MHLIDASTANKPAITNTWVFTLFKALLSKIPGVSKSVGADHPAQNASSAPDVDSDDGSSASDAAPGSGRSTPKNGSNGERIPTAKAGGMRRKNVKRR